MPPNMHEESKFLIQVCGFRIAVLFQEFADAASPNQLVIWDWKSGQQILVRLAASFCIWNIEALQVHSRYRTSIFQLRYRGFGFGQRRRK